MPIVFAGITPHPPVLLPEIGKDNAEKIEQTKNGFKKIEQDLYIAQPESIVIISPYGQILDDAFNINLSPEYKVDFTDFGDFGLEMSFKSDYKAIQEIRASDEMNKNIPIVLTSSEKIDHGFGIPLHFLTQHLKDLPIIPITHSRMSLEEHYRFGTFLHRQLSKIDRRFAVIASTDLSHTLSKDAPGGFAKEGEQFDKRIVDLIKSGKFKDITAVDEKLAKKAQAHSLRPLTILAGMLEQMNVEPSVISYECPFGVGYMVADFKLK